MIVEFKTEHGSEYQIDYAKKTWTQLKAGNDHGFRNELRSESGSFSTVGLIKVGYGVKIIGPSLDNPTTGMNRLIFTSNVIHIVVGGV